MMEHTFPYSPLFEKPCRRLFILVDENVYALYKDNWGTLPARSFLHLLPSGEAAKTWETASGIYSHLLNLDFSKEDLLVNVGGGVVCDMGGFVAATYKRGIPFVNIPTTLLAMIDAAHGGKNGLNHAQVKNSLGTIYFPEEVIVDPGFLDTLPRNELRNGWGELLKYALVSDPFLWEEIHQTPEWLKNGISTSWIHRCIDIKNRLVAKDPYDRNERRILNFGHTVGHALESFYLARHQPIAHGHAVAIGMCCESYISFLHHGIDGVELEQITKTLLHLFPLPDGIAGSFPEIFPWMGHDKKNSAGKINVTLLEALGRALPNQETREVEVWKSFDYIMSLGR